MGREPWSFRNTVEECRSFDIPWLSRHGYFQGGFRSGVIQWKNAAGEVTSSIGIEVTVGDFGASAGYARLSYTETSRWSKEKKDLDYTIELVTTPCNFGGYRFWFICPLIVDGYPCRRRVGKLYLPPGGTYFGCRHCHNLTYECQKEHNKWIDVLKKNPELLLAQVEAGDYKASSLVIKSLFRTFGKS